jgi:hypothetical protein
MPEYKTDPKEKPSLACKKCKKPMFVETVVANGTKPWCEQCCIDAKLLHVWESRAHRYPSVKTPTLAKGRFALQSLKDKTWIEQVEPMRWTAHAKSARLFNAVWLNTTNWQWSDWYAARSEAQVREAAKKK